MLKTITTGRKASKNGERPKSHTFAFSLPTRFGVSVSGNPESEELTTEDLTEKYPELNKSEIIRFLLNIGITSELNK